MTESTLTTALATNERLATALYEHAGRRAPVATAGWVAPELLDAGVDHGSAGSDLGRRIGRELVDVADLGLVVRREGIGTPEKAYRRCDGLLARECEGDRYAIVMMEGELTRIAFEPAEGRPVDGFFCHVRIGMFQALPGLFGRPFASVRELQCASRGADRCLFEVRFRRAPRAGFAAGLAVGASIGVGGLLAQAALGATGWPTLLGWTAALLATGLASLAGHTLDVTRRLRAFEAASARAPGVLRDAEHELTEKVEELARFERVLENDTAPTRSSATALGANEGAALVQGAARELHGTVVSLERALGDLHRRVNQRQGWTHADLEAAIEHCVGEAREIHGIGSRLARSAEAGDAARQVGDLRVVVGHAVEAFGAGRADDVVISFTAGESLPRVAFEPYQIELVVTQLLENAAAAVEGRGAIGVVLREEPSSLEIAISDDGPGIEDDRLDETFDPFFEATAYSVDLADGPGAGETGAGGDEGGGDGQVQSGPVRVRGVGLAVCYRIVKQHGGELRIESAPGCGTTLTIALPKDAGSRRGD